MFQYASKVECGTKCGSGFGKVWVQGVAAMGKLSAVQIKNLKEPGRYSDGEGLILRLTAPGRLVLETDDGRRETIGGKTYVNCRSVHNNESIVLPPDWQIVQ
jgi:hypothetical protein